MKQIIKKFKALYPLYMYWGFIICSLTYVLLLACEVLHEDGIQGGA